MVKFTFYYNARAQSKETLETLGNTRGNRISKKVETELRTEQQADTEEEEEMDTTTSLYKRSIEPEVSQEEVDRMALQKTIMSIDNRLTAMKGGMATFKTENARASGILSTGGRLIHHGIRKCPSTVW